MAGAAWLVFERGAISLLDCRIRQGEGEAMSTTAVVVIILIPVLVIGGGYAYRAGWGEAPVGIIGLLVIVLLVLLLTGVL